jgi:branched-chain amino acid transport system ATP-binding protein
MTAILQVTGLHVFYGMIHALKGINIDVQEGEMVALIGANGAGKTTFLKAITGLVPAKEGSICLRGQEIRSVAADRRVGLGIAMAPEGRGIFPNLTVRENLMLGAYLYINNRDAVAKELKSVFGYFPRLSERENQSGGTLSGGEQQMLSIARALMSRPRILLLDEPSMGLAPFLVRDIFEMIARIRQAGTTVLLVEQNAKAALRTADRAYVLETGAIVRAGKARELSNDPEVRAAYLG